MRGLRLYWFVHVSISLLLVSSASETIAGSEWAVPVCGCVCNQVLSSCLYLRTGAVLLLPHPAGSCCLI